MHLVYNPQAMVQVWQRSNFRSSTLHGPVVLFWLRLLLRLYRRMEVFFKQEISLPCLLIICGCWYPLHFLVYIATCSAIYILLLCYLLAFFMVVMMIRASRGLLCNRAIEIPFLTFARTRRRTLTGRILPTPARTSSIGNKEITGASAWDIFQFLII